MVNSRVSASVTIWNDYLYIVRSFDEKWRPETLHGHAAPNNSVMGVISIRSNLLYFTTFHVILFIHSYIYIYRAAGKGGRYLQSFIKKFFQKNVFQTFQNHFRKWN